MTVDIATLAIRIDSLEAQNATRDLQNLRDTGGQVERSTDNVSSSFRGLAAAIQLAALIKMAQEFIQAGDAVAMMDARLKLATKSAMEFATAQKDVYRIAQANNLGLIETATLYTKLADPVRNLGGSTRETAAIVDAFATTLRISGASTEEAAAATMQFAQAMGSGKLSGDEFRSMAETSPRFMKAMADGMNVPIGKLKEMAGDGKLTADVVGNALTYALATLKAEAATIPTTVGGAFVNMKNDVLVAIGEINKGMGTNLGIVNLVEEARKLIPLIKDELAGAFQSVSVFLDQNRGQFSEMWDITKGIIGDVWEIAKAASSVAGFLFEWTDQASGFKTVLETARFLLAGFQDGVQIIGAGLAKLGSMIMQEIVSPLQMALTVAAKIAGAFDEKMAARINGLNQEITDFVGAGAKYGDQVFDAFARGDSAVAQLDASMRAVKEVKDEMYKGWLASDIEYAEKAAVVLKAYATYSVEIQRAAMKSLTEGMYGFTKLNPLKVGPDEKAIKAANAELEKQRKLMAELAGVNADYMEDLTRLQVLRAKQNMTDEHYIELVEKLIGKQPAAKKLMDEAAAAAKRATDAHADYIENLQRTTAELISDARAQQDVNDRIGLSKTAIAELDAQRLDHLASLKDENAELMDLIDWSGELSKQYRDQAQALRDRAEAMRDGGMKEAHLEWLKDAEATVKKYDDIFSKGFADMLNNGKDGWKSFTKSLVTTFKTSVADQIYKMFLQPFVMKIIASFAGASGSAGGGAMQWLEMGKSIFSGFNGAFSSGMGNIVSQFGNMMGSQGISAFGTGMGMTAGQASTAAGAYTAAGNTTVAGGLTSGASAGSMIPYVGWIAAAMTVANNLYKEGWDPNNGTVSKGMVYTEPLTGTSTILNKLFQGLGMSDKTANLFSGASFTSKLFGRKNAEVESFGIEGNFGAGGFDGNAYQNMLQKGGIFRSDKRYQNDSALDAGTESTFDDTIKNLMLAVKGFGAQMGIEATAIDGYTKAINLTLTADEAKNQELIAAVFGGMGDDLARLLLPTISELSLKGESAGAALQRIATNYAFVDAALDSVGMSFGAVGAGSLAARERLVSLVGGLDAMGNGAMFFAQNFLTEAQRMAPIIASVDSAMAAMNLSHVKTRDQFAATVLGLDLTTEAGAKQFAGLMKIQEAFAIVNPAMEAVAVTVRSLADIAGEAAALQDQLDELTMTPDQKLAKARGKLAPENTGLFDQVQGALAAQTSAEAAAAATAALAAANQVYIDQLHELDRLTMTASELRDDDIAGLAAETVAYYDLLMARRAGIAATESEAAALKIANEEKVRAAQAQTDRIIEDMNKRSAATVAAVAVQQKADADLLALAGQRAAMEWELFKLTHDAAAVLAEERRRELAALNGTLHPLQSQINAMQDQASAAALAATALENAAAKARAIQSEGSGIARDMMQLTGDTAGLRALELAATAVENRVAKQAYFNMQDKIAKQQAEATIQAAMAQAAAQAAAEQQRAAEQAVADQQRAAEQFKSAWQGMTDSILDEVARIRGVIAGGGAQGFAGAQSAFAIASAQARAGDQDAAKLLPQLSQTMLTLAEANAVTAFDLNLVRAQTAASLQMTAGGLGKQFGLNVPSFDVGTDYVTSTGLAMVHAGEEIKPAGASRPFTGGGGNSEVIAELRAVRAELAELRRTNSNENYAIAKYASDTADALDKFETVGMPPEREEA